MHTWSSRSFSARTGWRHAGIAVTVLAIHAGALWLAQTSDWEGRRQEMVVTAAILVDKIATAPPPPQKPAAVPSQPPAPAPAAIKTANPKPVVKPEPPSTRPEPRAVTSSAPSSPMPALQSMALPETAAETGLAQHPQLPSPPSTPPAPVATVPAVTAAPAPPSQRPDPPRVELPSSQAGYLHNPKPPYPLVSKRLQEEGKVVVRVLIESDGHAAQAEVHSSSGYERLDRTALQTVLRWRYVPGKRNGVPEAMWVNIPIHFVLE